jgi:fructose-1-phosphate kinase PfkB-like protein
MVKVNQHELSGYLGKLLDSFQEQLEAIWELQAGGIPIVALSRGKDGMIATDGAETYQAKVEVESIVNVVGAGDSTLAGVSKCLLENKSLEEIVSWGVACGTANTQVRGAGFITPGLVDRMLSKVKINQL